MFNVSKGLIIVVLCLAVAGCPPNSTSSTSVKISDIISAGELARADLQYYWPLAMELPLEKGETIERLQLLDENLYCLTSENRLMAIDASIGTLKWCYDKIGADETVFQLSHVNSISLAEKPIGPSEIMGTKAEPERQTFDAVLINTIEYVVVLDREKGWGYRKIPFKFAANSAGVSDGRHFFVGSIDGGYYAIALNEAVQAWRLSTESMISAPLKYSNDRIFVASEDHKFYCSEVGSQGTNVWTHQMDAAITAPFHVGEIGCFVPCRDNRLYAFDSRGGKLWSRGHFVCQGPLTRAVQVSENTVFQYADDDGFYAININNGRKRWDLRDYPPTKVVAMADGEVYLFVAGGQMLVVNEMSGEVKHSLVMSGMDIFTSNTDAPAIYAARRDGKIFCIRLRKAGQLTAEMLRGES